MPQEYITWQKSVMSNIKKIHCDENLTVYLLDMRDDSEFKADRTKSRKVHDKAKEILLKDILGADETALQKNEYGKPYLSNGIKYFSISHDMGITVLGVSDIEIGIDIEKICEAKWPVINRLFPIDYKNRVAQAGEAKNMEFIKCWTLIEAVLKARGTGFRETGISSEKLDFLNNYETGSILYEDFVISFAYEKEN